MSQNIYAIYARRTDEKNWSDWCRVEDFDRALEHCDTIRSLGYKAKIYDTKTKKTLLKDS